MHTDEPSRRPGLTAASSGDLKQLASALCDGSVVAPLTIQGLSQAHLSSIAGPLLPFLGLSKEALLGLIEAVLAERDRASQRAVELVWSGPDAGPSYTRYTSIVVPELIDGAKQNVTIAGYSFDEGGGVFQRLHAAQLRGVTVRLFVDIDQLWARLRAHVWNHTDRRTRLEPVDRARNEGTPSLFAEAVLGLFREEFWPYQMPLTVFYDPRTAERRSFASLHAKCLIVDTQKVLVTSANFTGRGQDRNIEVGVIVRDPDYATALETQWNNLVNSRDVLKG